MNIVDLRRKLSYWKGMLVMLVAFCTFMPIVIVGSHVSPTAKTQQIYLGFQLFARHFRTYYYYSQWSWLLFAWILICLLSNHPATWLSTRIDFVPIFCGKHLNRKFLFNKNPLPPRIHIDNFDMKGPAFSTAFGEALQKGKALDSAFGCEKIAILVTKPVGLDDDPVG